jgi:hypothetical protein
MSPPGVTSPGNIIISDMELEHPQSERKQLPNRRVHGLPEFEHGGFRFTVGFGRFGDGSLAEVFLNGTKIGTPIDVNSRDAGRNGLLISDPIGFCGRA